MIECLAFVPQKQPFVTIFPFYVLNLFRLTRLRAKEKSKRATKLSNQGGERIEQDLFFHLGFMGSRPEGNGRRLCKWIWATFHELVLLVIARHPASSDLCYGISICVHQGPVNTFKVTELFFGTDNSILLTSAIPRKPAVDEFKIGFGLLSKNCTPCNCTASLLQNQHLRLLVPCKRVQIGQTVCANCSWKLFHKRKKIES